MSDATEITRAAQSNLAFALRILPKERRDEMVVFYAFCRSMDDLADDPGQAPETRREALTGWRDGLTTGFANPSPLQREVIALRDRRQIPTNLLTAIIDGCLMDLDPPTYATWAQLDTYIWMVACAVGLVSVRLFGCHDFAAADPYAEALGRALQLTNIIRDVGEDFANGGRIYLPREDLDHFGYHQADLASGTRNEAFVALMKFQSRRAHGFFEEAGHLLPTHERKPLAPARAMAAIYRNLLEQMQADGFQVFARRYRVPKSRKLAILLREWIFA